MLKLPKIDIIDTMVKSNSILVGLSLLLLMLFVGYGSNWFAVADVFSSTTLFQTIITSSYLKYVPLIIIIIPFIGSIVELYFAEVTHKFRDHAVIYSGFITLVVVQCMYPFVIEQKITLELDYVFELGVSFQIDMLSYIVLLLSSYIWFYVMVYAHVYMQKEQHSTRFFFFLGLTYTSVLGAIASGDLLTMFFFLEIMTLASYMLVIHGQNDESYRAGYKYIIMGLIGGFLLFTAIILMYFYVGDLRFETAIVKLNELGSLKYWIMLLVVLGFGIKAGMAPLHVWLPKAHPVAPSPASALLSGVMIKVGAFGILRVATSYYFPSKDMHAGADDAIWNTASNIGAFVIWAGIVTMIVGVFMALQQANIKKMLAYHSISQMGYIIVGIGVGLYLGYKGAMGYTGAIYHIMNHALYKSLLFMVAGIVYYHTHELDMYKLGGLWKKIPITTIVFIVAALGISGVPLFNGYVSKTILHHSIVEAYEYGSPVFFYAELLFILVSVGTACSFIKMFYYVFVRKTENEYPDAIFDFSSFDIALWAIAFIIILIGLNPQFIVNALILPQLSTTAYSVEFIDHYIVHLHVFALPDLLMTMLILGLGALLFIVGRKFHLFHLTLPKWMYIEYWFFLPAYLLMRNMCRFMYGDKCPIYYREFKLMSLMDTEQFGFTDRFITTANVLNRRYEQSIIRKDALIYSFFVTLLLLYLLIDYLWL